MATAVARESKDVLVVVLDRGHARFFEVRPDGAIEHESLQSPTMRGGRFHSDHQGGPGWGEREYHARLHEEERRHVEGIVDRLAQLDHEHGFEGIVVAGPGPATAALARALPASLRVRLLGTAHLTPREVTLAAVSRVADTARSTHRLALERELVAAVEAGVGRGRATNGARETLRALGRGQVRTLLVAAGVTGAGFRCATTGRLVLDRSDCRGEGEAVPVADLAAQALDDARRQGAATQEIRDPEVAGRIDGLAALLRYPS